MTTKFTRLAPTLAVLGSVTSLCFGTSFGKQLFPLIGPAGTISVRVGLSALILLAIWRPWRLPLSRQDAKLIALYGASLGFANLTFYMSLSTLPLGVAIAIEFMGPLAVAILDSRKLLDFFWILLAAVGVTILLPIIPGNSSLNPVGVCYALGGALFWALYIIFGKRASNVHEGQAISLGMTMALLSVLPFSLIQAGPALLNSALLMPGLSLAILSSAIPFSLELFALKRLPKSTFGVLVSMEPAVGALAGFTVLGEHLTAWQWLAIALIVTASIGSSLCRSAKPAQSANLADIPADTL